MLVLILGGFLFAAACAPAAPPPPPTAAPTTAAKAAVPTATATVAPKPAATATKRPLDKVKLSLASSSPLFFPLRLAKDMGFFEQEGLDVEVVEVGAAISIKSLIGGSHDFDSAVGSSKVAVMEGADIRNIAVNLRKAPWWIYSKPEIKSIAELKGKKMEVPTIGSALDTTAGVV
ncbi:MAG: ABC transporter substrate-binding protein, partial [Dehalococcoidia bacterium]|nr:ABC transporter substrate-binding protein [Dehalococcoidia bacterium]